MKCDKHSMLTGTGCDLEAGHDGKHVRTYTEADGAAEPYSASWSDDADRRAVDSEAGKKLGT